MFITTHGAAIMNMLYLEPHSAVVEILTSPWYEPAYQCTALALDVAYFVVPQTNISRSFGCVYASECMDLPLTERSRLDCFGLRQCSVEVDILSFEIMFLQASQAVRIKKRGLHKARTIKKMEERSVDYRKPTKRTRSP